MLHFLLSVELSHSQASRSPLPIAMEVTQVLDGIPSLTAAIVVITDQFTLGSMYLSP
ncbi:LrgB family protein [Prevotella sp. P5-92]|uniref:LrgB family protein n=1 Tax=Prevotella sp. P5-92 TaxID=2024222 RepID=UPI00352BDD97